MLNQPIPHQQIRVLMVEDNEADADLIVNHLSRAGFEVNSCRVDTQRDYLARLDSSFDVILSDYSMPQFDALKALRLLRETGWDIPFIIVSGTIGEERAVAAIKQGVEDYLPKDRLGRLGTAVARAMEKRRLRAERKQAESELREGDARFRQLAGNISEVFWIRDIPNDQLIYISPGYHAVWGRNPEELYCNQRLWLESIHPDDRQRVLEAAHSRQVLGSYNETYRILHRDGSERWVRDRAFPVHSPQGEVCRVVGIVQDITRQRSLEEHLRQAQKMEAVGQLASGIAHDFNNILAVIRGCTVTLLTNDLAEPERRCFLSQIAVAADRAARLTAQLLTFSRKQVMQPKIIDLHQVVLDVGTLLQRVLGEDVALENKGEPGRCFVHADTVRLEQVLMNLAVNARDAMPRGGQLLIETSRKLVDVDYTRERPQSRAGEFVLLRVSDTGCGISPEIMSRMFKPFFTTKGAGKGIGLGLATVHGIAQQHQGWVDVESRVGHGTTFTLFLPAARAVTPAVPVSASATIALGGTETILLVEDDEALRRMVATALRRWNYRVIEAGSSVEAFDAWKTQGAETDLVITDMIMPGGVSGAELMEGLWELKPGLKVIFTSGHCAEGVRSRCALEEGVNFLQKPFLPELLAKVVRHRLNSS